MKFFVKLQKLIFLFDFVFRFPFYESKTSSEVDYGYYTSILRFLCSSFHYPAHQKTT